MNKHINTRHEACAELENSLDQVLSMSQPNTEDMIRFCKSLAMMMRLKKQKRLAHLTSQQEALLSKSLALFQSEPEWTEAIILGVSHQTLLTKWEEALKCSPVQPTALFNSLLEIDATVCGLSMVDAILADELLNQAYLKALYHVDSLARISDFADAFVEIHQPSDGLAELWMLACTAKSRRDALENLDSYMQAESKTESRPINLLIDRFREALGLGKMSLDSAATVAYASEELPEETPHVQALGELFYGGVKVEYFIEHFKSHSDLLIHAHRELNTYVLWGDEHFPSLEGQDIIIPLRAVKHGVPLEFYVDDALIKTFTVS